MADRQSFEGTSLAHSVGVSFPSLQLGIACSVLRRQSINARKKHGRHKTALPIGLGAVGGIGGGIFDRNFGARNTRLLRIHATSGDETGSSHQIPRLENLVRIDYNASPRGRFCIFDSYTQASKYATGM